MYGPICGEFVAEQIIQGEAALTIHRLLKHQAPVVQGFATVALSVGAVWLFRRMLAHWRLHL